MSSNTNDDAVDLHHLPSFETIQLELIDMRPVLMRLPGDAPFLFEFPLILMKNPLQLLVLKLVEGDTMKMVDENIFSTD